jgi:D-xylose 1-dehydrogenase (NADP+, D-xylono-1,5-lactone-forming)
VLCEKPLAMNAGEAREMAQAAEAADRLLMEAFMYRFHPRMRAFVESAREVLYLHATFAFPLRDASNYRLVASLGGGALLDVGCYTVSVARWILGEPERLHARARVAGGVDMSITALLEFAGGAGASLWASFEAPEEQELAVVMPARSARLERPFSAWRDPEDPYQLMVESFADSVLHGRPPAVPLSESIANMAVLDRIAEAARAG